MVSSERELSEIAHRWQRMITRILKEGDQEQTAGSASRKAGGWNKEEMKDT